MLLNHHLYIKAFSKYWLSISLVGSSSLGAGYTVAKKTDVACCTERWVTSHKRQECSFRKWAALICNFILSRILTMPISSNLHHQCRKFGTETRTCNIIFKRDRNSMGLEHLAHTSHFPVLRPLVFLNLSFSFIYKQWR